MRRLSIDPYDTESVARHLVCSNRLKPRKTQFASAVVEAYSIVNSFASLNGWLDYMQKPLFTSVHIFETWEKLWQKIKYMTRSPEESPPTDGLSAAIHSGCLMAVTQEEYERLRPEYASVDKPWARLLAHEIAHQLHIRIVGTEKKMGPKWFYEGFAMYASGQRFSGHVITSFEGVLEAMHAESRGSYAKYVAAFEFFLDRIDLKQMLREAGKREFEAWLLSRTAMKKV